MLGDNIRNLRKGLNLTQNQLAEKFNVTMATISNWEIGNSNPTNEQIKDLCKFFNVSADYLLGVDMNGIDEKKLMSLLIEAGIIKPDGQLSLDELKLAIDSYQQYKNAINKKDINKNNV